MMKKYKRLLSAVIIGFLILSLAPAGLAVAGEDTTVNVSEDVSETGGTDASSHFHASITANKETYTSGETALVSVKYTIDQGTVSPGDYVVVSIPPDIASKAVFSVSSQHFSGVEDLGNGQYKLTFGENASTGLSGSMTIRVTTHTEETATDKITAGDGEKEITVVGNSPGSGGTGTFADEAIMKDGLGNDGMSYGGYDYSGDNAAQIGLFDSSVDQSFDYRLFINRKNVSMTGVVVEDSLPDGIYFDGDASIVSCYKIDPATMLRTDTIVTPEKVNISGRKLTVVLGDIDFPVEIEYRVSVPAQTSVRLRNHAEITYTQDGETHQEYKDYIAQGNDYSASNGVKSVDKTIISDDPADQWVTYTIKFWNDNKFDAGEINLTDDLDDYVQYLYSDESEYFELTVDENDPTILHIRNKKEIPESTEVYVSFVCDFSKVPVGYTVYNTTGGNTTRTRKIAGSASFEAKKTVDGSNPAEGEQFSFILMDQNRNVLQTVNNEENGNITFKGIKYGADDLGKTYTYYIAENTAAGDDSYEYDESEYCVQVQVARAAGEDGVIPVSVKYSKDGIEVNKVVFDNSKIIPETISVSGSKTWDDKDDQDGKRPESITVNLYADGRKIDSRTVTAEDNWSWTFEDFPKYDKGELVEYSIDEDPVAGYQSEINGYNLTNTYTPGKISIPVRKVWDDQEDQDGIRAENVKVILYKNGVETDQRLLLNEENHWSGAFNGLDEYSDGNKIDYTIKEQEVSGYRNFISGSADEGYMVTNIHAPETVTVSGAKTWDDKDDQDGKRPESITVNLYADGRKVDSRTVTAKDNWSWTFEDFPKYDKGELVEYSIDEDPVAGYQSEVNGYDLTNTFAAEKIIIPVRKVWEDKGDKDKLRPSEVTIHLLADGKETGKSLTLDENTNWRGAFGGLDKYSGGKKIVYSVSEESVAGYNTVITGTTETGFVITNSHSVKEEAAPEKPQNRNKPNRPEQVAPSNHLEDTSVPKTGDESHIYLWMGVMAASLFILLIFVLANRKMHR